MDSIKTTYLKPDETWFLAEWYAKGDY